VIVPNSNYRPNPERAIFVQGEIDLALLQRLTPEILLLQHKSREPITAYINSPGGAVEYMFALLRLLRTPTQDGDRPCHLITVVTTRAASAAADLLTYGSYSLAYPDSIVLFHGVRFSSVQQLTAERSSLFAQVLRRNNENSAMDLAREIEYRFMFRFITSRPRFDGIRQKENSPDMSDFDCFVHLISQNISSSARSVLQTAQKRHARYNALVQTVANRTRTISKNKTALEIEAAQIRAILAFEVMQNKEEPEWSFQTEGVHRLTDDFLLFHEYQAIAQSEPFKRWCSQIGFFLVDEKERYEINQIGDRQAEQNAWTEKVGPELQPVWTFFVALCHSLQQGENELTAQDAYWLGLIDEVIGDEDLRPIRLVYENQEDPLDDSENESSQNNASNLE
jgi:ATP-dependent protease ClpP protease subunit